MTDDIALEWAASILGCEPGPWVKDLSAYKFLREALKDWNNPYANGYAAGLRDGINASKE